MNKKQEANVFIKECITTALLQLIEATPLDEIALLSAHMDGDNAK